MQPEPLEDRIERLERDIRRLRGHHRRTVLVVTLVAFLGSTLLYAIPHSFSTGDIISASEINDNFSFLNARTWSLNGSDLYFSSGNVGIGTDTPTTALSVAGQITDADGYVVSHATAGTRIESGQQSYSWPGAVATGTINFTTAFSATPQILLTSQTFPLYCTISSSTTTGFGWRCVENISGTVVGVPSTQSFNWLAIGN